jgi:hypothetical protein
MSIAHLTCPACSRQFDLTPDYLAQYGGQTTACACGQALVIPTGAVGAPGEGPASEEGGALNDSVIQCPHCGKRYKLTAAYLASYGGRETNCEGCRQPMRLPAAPAAAQPGGTPTLNYSAAEYPPKPAAGVWRDGDEVVCVSGAKFPPRCFVCNEPSGAPPREITLKWIPRDKKLRSGLLAGAFGGGAGLLSMWLADANAPRVTLTLTCCPAHRLPVVTKPTGGICIALAFITALLIVGLRDYFDPKFLIFVPGLLLLVGVILVLIPYPIRITAYDKGYAWMRGFPKLYRNGLPSLRAAYERDVGQMSDRIAEIQE